MPSILYITFLNNLGGFEYFPFYKKKEFQVDITDSGTSRNNILPSWPNSYGKNADTLEKQTFRVTRNRVIVTSQHLSLSQLNALSYIKSSTVVQIVTTRRDRRTVIVDTDSFKKYSESDKLFTLQFSFTYTDEIPSQTV
ncbi:MAG TPA: hypothetical protein VFZ33_21715 [Chitinophagaceae bacterium]